MTKTHLIIGTWVHCIGVIFLTGLAGAAALAGEHDGSVQFKDCYAKWTATQLTLGNSTFERSWELRGGKLVATSLFQKPSDEERLLVPKSSKTLPNDALQVTTKCAQRNVIQPQSLQLELSIGKKWKQRMQIFPGTAGVVIWGAGLPQNAISTNVSSSFASSGIEAETPHDTSAANADALDSFSLRSEHLRLIQVNFTDETDHHNELAYEREWLLNPAEERLDLSGNLIFMEDALMGAGICFLKLAPLPHARPVKTDSDFTIKARQHEVEVEATDYPVAIIPYTSGRIGRIIALQQFQRELRPFDAGRDGVFLSNTWGDRARDSRVCESFVQKEIEAGSKMGVDVVQIDDGWQQGRTKNSAQKGGVWGDWWTANPNFWNVDATRFPHGLEPLIASARQQGMQLGLWYAPDSANDGANWEKDAARMLDLHKMGINYFKIDSLKEPTLASAVNHRKMFDRVLEGSAGRVVFDLDVTAGIRPGYFGIAEIGPLFLENRYTDWHNYWPHDTLRNLWNLAQHVDPNRLRVECLNNARNLTLYENDPLAPSAYPPDTLFAITMIANPLGWFEVSSLPQSYTDKLMPLVATWKRERSAMHGAATIPIGAIPDGVSWTGFASTLENGKGGYVVLFREMNESADHRLELRGLFHGQLNPTVLGGRGSAEIVGNELVAHIPAKFDFLWLRLDTEQISRAAIGQINRNSNSL